MSDPAMIEQSRVAANGQEFHVVTAGPVDGPPVVLLHGFPELSWGWRHQIEPLARRGFRVVVPDQRGYGYSSKPRGTRAYRVDVLAQDVVSLAEVLGHYTFSLVGHDWGGIVAWRVASDHAARVERLAILNAPNLDVALSHALRHPGQLLKSAYVGFFQMPLLPESALSSLDFTLLDRAMTGSAIPGTFTPDDMAVYREAWSQPGALTAMLNWYRALPGRASRRPKRITAPTQIIWGDRDTALDASLAEDSAALCDDVDVRHLPDATHWVHHERPDEVNALLASFLGGASAPEPRAANTGAAPAGGVAGLAGEGAA